MRAEIEIALRMLAQADSTIPPDGRIDKAIECLRGIDHNLPDLVQIRELRTTLHLSRATIDNLIERGKLRQILGADDRLLGVSRESLRRFLQGEIRLSDGTNIDDIETKGSKGKI